MVLMALGLLTRPVVTAISEMHAVAHPELAAHDASEHSHGESVDVADAGRTSDDGQPEHTEGPHGLMHQASGGDFDRGIAALEVPIVSRRHLLVPAVSDTARIPERLSSPFRPPIA